MKHFKLFFRGADVGSGHQPWRFDVTVPALDEHHARAIARRVYGYFTLTELVPIIEGVGNV